MGEARKPLRSAPDAGADPLMARIDRSLAHWPSARADRLAEDDRADAITAQATAGAALDAGDADVLGPPLPRAPGEGGGDRRRSRGWLVPGAIAAAAIAAAVGAVAIRTAGEGEATTRSTDGSRVTAASPSPAAAPAARGPATIDVPGVDPALLPLVPPERAVTAPSAAAPRVTTAVTGRSSGGSPAGPAQVPSPGSPGAAGSDDSLVPAAALAPGSTLGDGRWSVPRKPSIGAVQGAFGAALPGARGCLGAGDPAYHATVTFQSDGAVRDVAVGEGDPAKAACVRTALAKASVPPFAEGSYAAPVTVRAP